MSEDLQPRDIALLQALRDRPLDLTAAARAARLPRPLAGLTARRLVELGLLDVERPSGGGRFYRLTEKGTDALGA